MSVPVCEASAEVRERSVMGNISETGECCNPQVYENWDRVPDRRAYCYRVDEETRHKGEADC